MTNHLANRLRELREHAGITQAEAVQRSRTTKRGRPTISQGYLSRLEAGRATKPGIETIMTLARIYGVQPLDIIALWGDGRAQK